MPCKGQRTGSPTYLSFEVLGNIFPISVEIDNCIGKSQIWNTQLNDYYICSTHATTAQIRLKNIVRPHPTQKFLPCSFSKLLEAWLWLLIPLRWQAPPRLLLPRACALCLCPLPRLLHDPLLSIHGGWAELDSKLATSGSPYRGWMGQKEMWRGTVWRGWATVSCLLCSGLDAPSHLFGWNLPAPGLYNSIKWSYQGTCSSLTYHVAFF